MQEDYSAKIVEGNAWRRDTPDRGRTARSPFMVQGRSIEDRASPGWARFASAALRASPGYRPGPLPAVTWLSRCRLQGLEEVRWASVSVSAREDSARFRTVHRLLRGAVKY